MFLSVQWLAFSMLILTNDSAKYLKPISSKKHANKCNKNTISCNFASSRVFFFQICVYVVVFDELHVECFSLLIQSSRVIYKWFSRCVKTNKMVQNQGATIRLRNLFETTSLLPIAPENMINEIYIANSSTITYTIKSFAECFFFIFTWRCSKWNQFHCLEMIFIFWWNYFFDLSLRSYFLIFPFLCRDWFRFHSYHFAFCTQIWILLWSYFLWILESFVSLQLGK